MDIMSRFETNVFFLNIVGGIIASTVSVMAAGLGLTTKYQHLSLSAQS